MPQPLTRQPPSLSSGYRGSAGNPGNPGRVRRRVVRHSHVPILKISNKIVNNLMDGQLVLMDGQLVEASCQILSWAIMLTGFPTRPLENSHTGRALSWS